jgi:phosphate transport system protein
MERRIDERLGLLKQQLIRMSALAETMIAAAARILTDRVADTDRKIDRHEREVDRMQVEIDEMCLDLIALYQPTASDLRFILGAVKTNAELERLADQAVNLAKKAERLLAVPPPAGVETIRHMATVAVRMLRDSLHAYVNRDVNQARLIVPRDDELDRLKAEITDELMAAAAANPSAARTLFDLMLIARNLERIGDHATNIAENTVFVAEGKDIRHATANPPA